MQNIMCKCEKNLSFWGTQTPYRTFAPEPHWGDFRSPSSTSCIQWQWVPLLQSTVVF